jgi:hypothetical protein
MADTMDFFKTIILVQIFFSAAMTILAYSLTGLGVSPNYISSYSELAGNINITNIQTDLESSLTQQQNIPVIEIGALIFYSGNILIDLLLNFFFAVPEMIGLLTNGISQLFSIDGQIWMQVQVFASVTIVALYVIGIIQLLTNVRAGRVV